MVGRVAVQQALHFALNVNKYRVGKVMNIDVLTVYGHLNARPGAHVTPWSKRKPDDQARAIFLAKHILREYKYHAKHGLKWDKTMTDGVCEGWL